MLPVKHTTHTHTVNVLGKDWKSNLDFCMALHCLVKLKGNNNTHGAR